MRLCSSSAGCRRLERELAELVACPDCGAPAGETCRPDYGCRLKIRADVAIASARVALAAFHARAETEHPYLKAAE